MWKSRLGYFGLVCFPTLLHAGIVEVGGAAVIAEPLPDIRLDRWESDTEVRVWAERSVVLGSPLAVDAVNTGTVFPGGVAGNIAAQAVESYMVRSDPIGEHDVIYSGFVVFDQPILGVIFLEGRLNDTNALLGRPGITYNANTNRGFEGEDTLQISDDRLRVDFDYFTGAYTDDVRIITAVPEPAALSLLVLGSAALLRRPHRTSEATRKS